MASRSPAATSPEPEVRLPSIGQILRRQWRLLCALAVVGALVGAAASLLWPPAYQASSRVLLQGDFDEARVISEAQIAMSLVVLDRAAAELNWDVDGPGLRDSVTAAVADGNVIEIKVKAGSPDGARQLAERVTQHYIAFSTEILTISANATGEVLAPRKDSLQAQVEDLDQRIRELESAGNGVDERSAAARAELQQLIGDRTDAAKTLDDLDERIATVQSATSRGNFSIIEPPVAPPAPVAPTRPQFVAGGLVLAAVLGASVLVGAQRADRRLWSDMDIAAALGAPILSTVAAPSEAAVMSPTNGSSNGHAGGRRSLLQRLLRNGAPWDAETTTSSESLEVLRYRRVLTRLRQAPDGSIRLLVIVVDDDVLARRAVGRLAIAAPTAVLSVVGVSAGRPTVPDPHDVSGVLVLVTSGSRTAGELIAIAEACHDAGHPVTGALVVLPGVAEVPTGDADPEGLPPSAADHHPATRAEVRSAGEEHHDDG